MKLVLILGLTATCFAGCSSSEDENVGQSQPVQTDRSEPNESALKQSFLRDLLRSHFYRLISKRLVENVGPIEGYPTHLDWLIKELAKSDDVSPMRNPLTAQMRKAYQQLAALRELDLGNKCNVDSYKILARNDLSTGRRAHVRIGLSGSPLRNRVDEIVYYYGLKHALECQTVYPVEFEQRYSELDTKKVHKVETFMKKVHHHPFLNWTENNPNRRAELLRSMALFNTLQIGWQSTAESALNTFQEIEAESEHQELLIINLRKEKLGNLLEWHIIEPCKYYVDKLGPGLLQSATYDKAVLEPGNFYPKLSPSVNKFLVAMDTYRICSQLVGKKSTARDSLLSNLVKIVT